MRAASSLWLCLAFALLCTGQTAAIVQYEVVRGVPLYSSGYLLIWNSADNSRVSVYGRDTKPMYSVTEDKNGVHHWGWVVDSDGAAAGARDYQAGDFWEGRIDVFDPSGKLARTINTGAFIPQHLAFFQDQTIWAVGYNAGNEGNEDFNVLHHYMRTGRELGQGVLWSQIAGNVNSYSALQPLIGGRRLFVGKNRIGFESHSHYGQSTWIEADSSGTFTGKYDLGAWAAEPSYIPFAMTASGDVYAAKYNWRTFDGWAVLDRAAKTWRKVAGLPNGRIIGADADRIVTASNDGGWTILRFIASESLRVEDSPETAALVR